jgi:signal transduction histidine kinase/ActR/RegA family two-component response regulator
MFDSTLPPPAAAAPHRPNAGIQSQVNRDRLRTLFELTPPPVAAGLSFVAVIGLLMWPLAPHGLILAWLVIKLVAGLVRMTESGRFARAAPAARHERLYWWRRYVVAMLVDAASWGAMTVIFVPHAHGIVATVLLAGTVGVAAVAVFTTVSHSRTCLIYLCAVLLPVMTDQLRSATTDGLLTALALLIYGLMLAYEGWRSEKRLIELLRLRYENADIAEQRQQALALAEHSNAAKSRFLAAVSHEMRTPLNGILGMTQLMRSTAHDEQHQHQLDIVQRSAQHLQTVIGDLLDLSRIEFGRIDIEQEPFGLVDTVREVTDLLAAIAAEKGLAFRLELEPGLPGQVRGDASRVKQVLHNLIGNAIKFTRRGEVVLQVAATAEGLRFSVRDTGSGIPARDAERVFDAFAQAGSGTARRGGTGLGLTISRQLARAMGGDVLHQAPETGGGALFHFTIKAPHLGQPVAAAERWKAEHFQLSGRVLVVDDSPVNAIVACSMLERFGIETEVAEDGEQALQRLRSQRYDAVLMDCQMPLLDGWEVTRRWRSEEAREPGRTPVPIVALTANAVVGDREQCLAAGMDDYLAKPFDLNDLGLMLKRYMTAPRLTGA